MGILNVTPDSFSDGGSFLSKENALEHAFDLIDQGADTIDIGAESTRPGSDPVSTEEELKRLIPILKDLAPSIDVPISVDTMKWEIAEAALNNGAAIINDICGMRDEKMISVAVSCQCPIVIMHMHGTPKTLTTDNMKGDFMNDIKRFLDERVEHVLNAGVKEKDIILDPGVGFGKTAEQNMEIIKNCGRFSDEYPILIGPSRKRFLEHYYPETDKDEATAAVSKIAVDNGADILRVHNVRRTKAVLFNE